MNNLIGRSALRRNLFKIVTTCDVNFDKLLPAVELFVIELILEINAADFRALVVD